MSPERKVPVVSTTTRLEKRTPSSVATPATRSPSNRGRHRLLEQSQVDLVSSAIESRACTGDDQLVRASHGLRAFGGIQDAKLDPASSVRSPCSPRRPLPDKVPFPIPRWTVARHLPSVRCCGQQKVRQPAARPQAPLGPAWPPPTTMTSNRVGIASF